MALLVSDNDHNTASIAGLVMEGRSGYILAGPGKFALICEGFGSGQALQFTCVEDFNPAERVSHSVIIQGISWLGGERRGKVVVEGYTVDEKGELTGPFAALYDLVRRGKVLGTYKTYTVLE